MRRTGMLSILTAVFLAFAAPAFAAAGLHAGMSLEPDDFLIGLHFSKPLQDQLTLVPSVEAGFGDATMIAGNLDLHYALQTGGKLQPYLGGGVTLNWFDFDGGSETDFGGSILGGLALSEKIYFETKVGLGDVPDWKFYIGWNKP